MGTEGRESQKHSRAGDDFVRRTGEVVVGFDRVIERADSDGIWLLGLSVKAPTDEGGDWFVVLRVRVDDKPMVGFNSASTFSEALKGALERFQNRSMKFRDDEYAR